MKWDYSIGCCAGVSGRESRDRTRMGGNNKGERIRMNERSVRGTFEDMISTFCLFKLLLLSLLT